MLDRATRSCLAVSGWVVYLETTRYLLVMRFPVGNHGLFLTFADTPEIVSGAGPSLLFLPANAHRASEACRGSANRAAGSTANSEVRVPRKAGLINDTAARLIAAGQLLESLWPRTTKNS